MQTSSGRGKAHPVIGHDGQDREERYSSTLSLTSTQDRVVVNVTPYSRKDPVPIV